MCLFTTAFVAKQVSGPFKIGVHNALDDEICSYRQASGVTAIFLTDSARVVGDKVGRCGKKEHGEKNESRDQK